MTDRAVLKEMQDKVDAATRALTEAKAFADEHGLDFYFDSGMGTGTYFGKGHEAIDSYKSYVDKDGGWYSSSMSC